MSFCYIFLLRDNFTVVQFKKYFQNVLKRLNSWHFSIIFINKRNKAYPLKEFCQSNFTFKNKKVK